jgi:hypothetical protein
MFLDSRREDKGFWTEWQQAPTCKERTVGFASIQYSKM